MSWMFVFLSFLFKTVRSTKCSTSYSMIVSTVCTWEKVKLSRVDLFCFLPSAVTTADGQNQRSTFFLATTDRTAVYEGKTESGKMHDCGKAAGL